MPRRRHHRSRHRHAPGWALTIGAAGALGHTISSLRERLSARTIAMRSASWLVGAGWTTWAMTTGPLTWAALGSLATIGVGMGAAARSTLLYEEARELEAIAQAERQVARELSAERRAIAAEWVDRVQRVCNITLRILAVEIWPTGTGFTIDAELPRAAPPTTGSRSTLPRCPPTPASHTAAPRLPRRAFTRGGCLST